MRAGARALRRVVREARPGRGRLAVVVALGTGTVLAGAALLAVSGYLISRAAERPPIMALAVAVVGVRALSLARAVLRYGERLAGHDVALRALARLRAGFVDRLVPLVPAGLPRGRAADLLSRYVGDVDALQHLFLRGLGPPVVAVLVVAAAALAAGAALPAAGLALALVLAVAAVALPLATGLAARAAGRRQAAARADLVAGMVDALQGAPEAVAWGRQGASLDRVAAADRRLARLARRDAATSGLAAALGSLMAAAAGIAVLVAATPAVARGELDPVLLAALVLLALGAFEAVLPLPVAAQHLASCGQAAVRLHELTDRPDPVPDPTRPLPAPAGLTLVAQGVTVRPPGGGAPILDGVDLVLARGRRVALVGPSGGGKTTLAEVLVRLREVDGGRVLMDGVPLPAYAQRDVRARAALVAQDAHLLAGSIADNLRIARPAAGEREMRDALARAGLAGWVAGLPDGLATQVGEDGARLSGGQRQRVALARGLLSGAGILLLDEPTAHLDPQAERAFLDDVLAAAGRGLGLLVVTHRMVALDGFDEVVVLDGGRVVQRGAPGELAARPGPLARMLAAT